MIVVRNIPLYWGIEEDASDRSFFTRSWLVEDIIPFRVSTWGCRLRIARNRWLHVGTFKYNREALHIGLSYRPSQIGRWGKDVQEEAAGSGAVGEGPAGPDVHDGSGDGAGGEPVEDGGTVSGTISSGTGSAVGAA